MAECARRLAGRCAFAPLFASMFVVCMGGCQPLIQTPKGFIELAERANSDYVYRAATPDGTVLAIRLIPTAPDEGGDLAFWSEAVTLRLRDTRGYELLSSEDYTSDSGQPGRLLKYGRDDEKGVAYRYWVALAIQERTLQSDRLVVTEAGGKEEAFKGRETALMAAIRSVDQ